MFPENEQYSTCRRQEKGEIMAFCSNCGNELPEGKNFCPDCGAPVNSSGYSEESSVSQDQPKSYTPPRMNIPEEPEPFLDKYGDFLGIILLILSILNVGSNPPVLTILFAAVLIAAGIYCLRRNYKRRGLTKAAIVISAICLLAGFGRANRYGITGKPGSSPTAPAVAQVQEEEEKEPEPKAETQEVKETPAEEESAQEKEEQTKETKKKKKQQKEEQTKEEVKEEKSSDGVDPDLKAFLDSYEKFIDEYVDFMKKYNENPDNMISMIGEYAEMMQKYADFADKIDQYDENEMSSADYKYYIEVTARCTQKMLEALE